MDKFLLDNIDASSIPQHVAIIMDGNGRWAKKQGLERTFGHKHAAKSVRSAIEACGDLNIPYLTLFAFSSENWKRPAVEVSFLMSLLSQSIQSELAELHSKNIKIKLIGDFEALPKKVWKELQHAIEVTKDNTKATLTLALSYGSKNEILHAVKSIANEAKAGTLNPSDITESLFENHLYTKGLPNVDLMIRTSGEYRISNFLLWQIAYAELYFTDVLWPDFTKEDFFDAVRDYVQRERRYGKTGEQMKTE
ncbi:isoprenyl transferase [Moheibacter sediminis]|uniref:Isoprenyl transferase n=1 Tax=Moheibacter sediminis TaxID=1434700 RepID=A0A1W1YAU6_9FLAO|nr:isoprenyl transferase [Moheibacter sediminis]SMC33302.1 undecaprenyl diphosphate synthase [Moheibacter sediminis]